MDPFTKLQKPNTPGAESHNDVSYIVMPQQQRATSEQSDNAPPSPSPAYQRASSAQLPSEPAPRKSKMVYIIIAIIALLAIGALAYFLLGYQNTAEPEETPQTTSMLPKVWLNQHFGTETCSSPNVCGDDADSESDGLSNYDEFKAGTSPILADSDMDGLADGDEVKIFKTDPTKKFSLDSDTVAIENGWDDGVQIKSGYDPLTPRMMFSETRSQQITEATATYGLHEPTITTISSQ